MNPYPQHPDFYNQPIRLSAAQQAAPLETLREFFDACPLSDVRDTLWNVVELSLARPHSVYDEATHRQTLLWFYRQLEMVLEAGWLLCREQG